MKNTLSALLITLLMCSCTSSVNVLKPEGESVSVKLTNGHTYKGELFSVEDTLLIFKYQEELYEVAFSDVRKVHTHGYSLRTSKILTAIPSIVFNYFWMTEGVDEEKWRYAVSALGALTILAPFIGNPKVNFSPPLETTDMEKLKLYCRYPQGLTEEQNKEVLQFYSQKDFHIFPE